MNNLDWIASEYAILDRGGQVHYETEGGKLCLINTEVMMLRRGHIIFSGKDEQLRETDDPYILRFLKGK